MINAENSLSEFLDSRLSGSLQTHLAARASMFAYLASSMRSSHRSGNIFLLKNLHH